VFSSSTVFNIIEQNILVKKKKKKKKKCSSAFITFYNLHEKKMERWGRVWY